MTTLRAGTGRCDITPAPGTPQGGWGAQTHQRGLGADLPLYSTALVVSDSSQSVAIINVNRRFRAPNGQMVVGRNWSGAVDPTVKVIRFDDLEENPVATIVHYACHPTTMAWQCQYVTPDYPGVVRQVVEQQVGGTCLFLQGATGNITPRRGFTGDLKVYRRLGKILGLEAAKIATSIETLPRRERFVG